MVDALRGVFRVQCIPVRRVAGMPPVQKGTQDQDPGRSKGGLSTNLRANPVSFALIVLLQKAVKMVKVLSKKC